MSGVLSFAGMRIHDLDLEEAVRTVCDRAAARLSPVHVVGSANSQGIREYAKNPAYRRACDRAFLTTSDGMSVVWGLRLLGKKIRARVAGSDLMPAICRQSAERGLRVFLLGGSPGTAEEAARILSRQYPGLQVAGVLCPPMGFDTSDDGSSSVVAAIRSARPDIVFVGLGVPKQEIWIDRHLESAGAPVMMGVGGTFSMICGHLKRAPIALQKSGLEWAWRLSMEPRRLLGRYLVCHSYFVYVLIKEMMGVLRKDPVRTQESDRE